MSESEVMPAIEPAIVAMVGAFRFPPTPALAEEVCAELELPSRGPNSIEASARSSLRGGTRQARPRDYDRRRLTWALALVVVVLAVIVLLVLVRQLLH